MRLQEKSLFVFVVLLILALLFISIFFSTVLLASYSALEEKYVAKDLKQAVTKLNDEQFSLSAIASDWGPWDDTVDFVNGEDPNFIKSNLQGTTFENLNLNLIIITNAKGESLYSGGFDTQNKVKVPVPEFFQVPLDPNNPLMNMSDSHQITSGILMLPEDPMLVVSTPIVHSDYSGQPHGVMIMGRYLNREEISRLAELTQPNLAIIKMSDPSLSPDLISRIRQNSGSAPGIIEPLNRDKVAGYALIRDLYGNDAFILHFTESRDIYHQGINTTVQVILIILAGGMFLGLVVIIFLERVLLKRMGSLALQVHKIGISENTSDHVEIEGDDELSGLATEINRMLDTIRRTQEKVLSSETRFRELTELLPLIIFEMDTTGNLMYVNRTGVEQFGITVQNILDGINIRQFLSPDNIEQMHRGLSAVMEGDKSPGEIYTLKKPNGDLMRAIVYTSLIHRNGEISGFRGVVLDISERIRLEEALTESKEYLQTLIQAIRVGIVVIDPETHTITDVNPAALELMGTTKDAVINQRCHKFICPAEVGKCPITDLNHKVDNAERTLLTPDGREISIIKYVVPVILHGKSCLLETFIDNRYRKQIELKLAESEEKYRTLTENSADIIFSIDLTGAFTYISPQVSRYGFTPDEVAGENFKLFIHPDDYENVLNNYQNEIHDGISRPSIFRITDKHGGDHWIEENSNIKCDQQGKPTGMVGVLRDVTDRVQVEDALRQSRGRLENILRVSPVIVFETDPRGNLLFASELWEQLIGYPFETMKGRHWAEILHPGDREFLAQEMINQGPDRKTIWAEARIIQPDGSLLWVLGQTVTAFNPDGSIRGYVGTITDITERKKIEKTLGESEEKYRALTENTGDILFSMDMDGILTYISPQVNKYGFLEDEITGKPFHGFIHPEDISRVEKDLSSCLEKGGQIHSTFRVPDKWGNIHWFDENATLRLDQSGKPLGIYGVLRDDSERKRAEDAIELANKKLNLMNNITRHDILNTITGLLGCVDMANATTSSEERMLLLSDIKNLTRIIQRQITFTKEYQEVGVHLPLWQNVNGVITCILQNFDASSPKFLIDMENMEIYADPLFEKVFYNLVDNAIRYGDTITTIKLYFQISDKGLSLICEDDGVGIPPEEKTRIFERGVGRNTGMGLFLTREILGITEILISENGVYGKGARFEILIPRGAFRFVL
jgi:PAS domain S-box-containing protein